MSEPLDPQLPDSEPFGGATDEAVSALIDGELAAFASDHGVTEAEATDRLTSWAGFEARAAELGGARAALRDPDEADASSELSELDRRRLVRNALAASESAPAPASGAAGSADSPSRRRVWQGIGAAAAAVVLIVGVGVALTSVDDGSSNDSSASKSTSAGGGSIPRSRTGDLGNVGNVTRPAKLRALLDPSRESTKANGNQSPSRTQAADSSSGELTNGGAGAGSAFTSTSTVPAAAPAVPPAAVEACAAQLAGSRPVVLTATGTYRGAPAVIVGIQDKGRTILFVVPPGDCTNVLTSISR